jgi:hypothetical protein
LGGLDEIRISKGIARYQGQNFTPPTIPYDVPVLSTDISDSVTGTNPPTNWSKYGTSIAWTTTADASAIGGKAIVPASPASNDAAIGYTSRQWIGDGEICAIIETGGTTTGTVTNPFILFRGSTTTGVGLPNGYGVGLMINASINSGVRCLAMVNHNVAWLTSPTFLWTANTKYAFRIRFQGVIFSVKCWQWGTAEPDNWTWEFNETTYQIKNGIVGFSLINSVRQGQCEWFSFAQGTGSASLPS